MLSIKFVKRLLISLLHLLSLLTLTGCASKSSRFGIVFTNNFADIYRIPDNTQSSVEQLTFTPTIGEYPLSVSRNGDKIIFEVGLTGTAEERQQNVYILDTSTKQLENITHVLTKFEMVSHDFKMDWSPDEKQFAFTPSDGEDLGIVNFDGTNKKDIHVPSTGEIPSLIQSVKWSPDGKSFILTRGVIGIKEKLENPGSAILIYDIESERITHITDYKDGCLPVEWSPTNQQIVATCSFTHFYGSELILGPEAIRIFDVKDLGQPYERIAFNPCQHPSWSPDGKQIALACEKDKDHMGLFIVNSDGNSIHEINLGDLGNPAVLRTPIWSPDGSQIIYTAGNEVTFQNIYSIQLDSSDNIVLTQESGYYRIVSVYPLP